MIYRKNNMTLRSDYNLIYRCEQCPCDGYYIGFFCSARGNGNDWNDLGELVEIKETGSLRFQPYPIPDNPFTGSDGILYLIPAKQAYYGRASGYFLYLFTCWDTGPSVKSPMTQKPFTSLKAAQEYMRKFEDSLKSLAAENCRVCTFRFWQDYLRLGDDPEQNVNAIDITIHGQMFKLYFSGFTNNGKTEYSAEDLLNASIWTDYQKNKYGEEYLPEITDDNGKSYAEAMGSAMGSPSFGSSDNAPVGLIGSGLTQIATFKSLGVDKWNEKATPIIPEGMSLMTSGFVKITMTFTLHIDAQRTDYIGYTDPDRTKRNYFWNAAEASLSYEYECSAPSDIPGVTNTIPVVVETAKHMRSITKNSLLLTYPQGVANNAVAGIEGPWVIDSTWDPTIPESGRAEFEAWRSDWRDKHEEAPTWEQILQHVPGQDWIIGFDAYNTADRITLIYYRDAISGFSREYDWGDNNKYTPADDAESYTINRLYMDGVFSDGCNGGFALEYFTDNELPEEFE